jgi:hypothetical protein
MTVAILSEAVKMRQSLKNFYDLDFPRLLGGVLVRNEFMYPPVELIHGVLCANFSGSATIKDLDGAWRKVKIRAPRNSKAHIRITAMAFSRQTDATPNFEVFVKDKKGQSEKFDLYAAKRLLLDDEAEISFRLNLKPGYEFTGHEIIYVAVTGFAFDGTLNEDHPEGWKTIALPVAAVVFVMGMLWVVKATPSENRTQFHEPALPDASRIVPANVDDDKRILTADDKKKINECIKENPNGFQLDPLRNLVDVGLLDFEVDVTSYVVAHGGIILSRGVSDRPPFRGIECGVDGGGPELAIGLKEKSSPNPRGLVLRPTQLQQRHVSAALRKRLAPWLANWKTRNLPIEIMASANDTETSDYAIEVKKLVESQGGKVPSIDYVGWGGGMEPHEDDAFLDPEFPTIKIGRLLRNRP